VFAQLLLFIPIIGIIAGVLSDLVIKVLDNST